jgi:formate dehydrogenase beta subunit
MMKPMLQPPCQNACPIHQDARGYLAAVASGDFNRAAQIVLETNPLPFICATICAHPCEEKCRRGQVDQPLSIRALKRVAMEHGKREASPAPTPSHPESVAVIGSGPAGLTAAHDLARMGYGVTIFEREAMPGGAMAHHVPLYRLPRELVKRDIEAIQALGVNIQTNTALGRDVTLEQLKRQGFRAVVLSLGLPLSRKLRIPGEEGEGVLLALPFLRAVNLEGYRLPPGKRVIVIGGGNVAIDAARSALRAGAKTVLMVCLEAPQEMPASPWEIAEAREEGIEINCSWGPKQVIRHNDKVAVIECMAVKAVFDAQGRFNPSFYEDRCTMIEGDIIILAIGQAADIGVLPKLGIPLNERGHLVFDPQTMTTGKEGVFACGEVILGPGAAVRAMAHARRAALVVDAYLRREKFTFEEPSALGTLAPEVVEDIRRIERQPVPLLEVPRRVTSFEEVDLGYAPQVGAQEARRCLNCGNGAELLEEKCIACLTCVRVCPYGVPVVRAAGKVDIRVDQCQACGICVSECPARAIAFRMPAAEDIPRRIGAAMNRERKELVFFCSYDTVLVQSADISGMIPVPCLGKIDIRHLLQAVELGAERIALIGCADADCPYQRTLRWAQCRVDTANRLLQAAGLGEGRVKLLQLAPQEFARLPEFLGPSAKEAT